MVRFVIRFWKNISWMIYLMGDLWSICSVKKLGLIVGLNFNPQKMINGWFNVLFSRRMFQTKSSLYFLSVFREIWTGNVWKFFPTFVNKSLLEAFFLNWWSHFLSTTSAERKKIIASVALQSSTSKSFKCFPNVLQKYFQIV